MPVPSPSDFAVTVNGSPATVTACQLAGSTVILTLSAPVIDTDVVVAAYTAPGDPDGIADIFGNFAASFTGLAIANLTDSGGPPQPPPSADRRYPAPPLSSPITLHYDNENAHDVARSLTSGQDYILVCDEIMDTLLYIGGGRNILVQAGQWNITNGSSDSYWDHTGIAVREGDDDSIVHIEGCLLEGATMNDGIVTDCNRTVQIQTCYINVGAPLSAYHPDCFQAQGWYRALYMDKVTMRTTYQGIFLGDHDAGSREPLGPTYLSRVDIHSNNGRYLFWKSDNRDSSPVVVIENCYLDGTGETLPGGIGEWVYPNESQGDFINYPWPDNPDPDRHAVASGGNVTWVGTNITGGFTGGSPSGGEFVDPSTVGLGYSP